jgi:hypothetical protein
MDEKFHEKRSGRPLLYVIMSIALLNSVVIPLFERGKFRKLMIFVKNIYIFKKRCVLGFSNCQISS